MDSIARHTKSLDKGWNRLQRLVNDYSIVPIDETLLAVSPSNISNTVVSGFSTRSYIALHCSPEG
jgi:hypothetical protein